MLIPTRSLSVLLKTKALKSTSILFPLLTMVSVDTQGPNAVLVKVAPKPLVVNVEAAKRFRIVPVEGAVPVTPIIIPPEPIVGNAPNVVAAVKYGIELVTPVPPNVPEGP